VGYLGFFIFFLLILFIGIFIVLLPKFLAPKVYEEYKLNPYECGEIPVTEEAWSRYNIRFYLLAISFIIFEVEGVFLLLWALNPKNLGIDGFIEIAIFVIVLFLGWIYLLLKGVIKWE
jgi:NADH-quinone oxidoreductase subunit A